MAFFLMKRLREFKSDAVTEFYSYIDSLLENEQVQQLDNYIQHYCYSRLKHSIDVAYYSFMIARILRWDCRSTARGGLLHDLFLYDWREEDFSGRSHAVNHPTVALENARAVCDLNKIEEDIIKKHMWIITLAPPSYREGYIVTVVDKVCAVHEFVLSLFSRERVRAVYSSE